MLELISGYATPQEWLMAAKGLFLFAIFVFIYSWITGEW
jgi:hypothetical protein